MIKFFKSLFSRKEIVYETKVITVEVLSKGAMERLKRQLEPPILSSADTAHTTGFKLGIQRALSEVEKGFSL